MTITFWLGELEIPAILVMLVRGPQRGEMHAAQFIKICGIQSIDEAEIAVSAGATAIGCLVGLTHLANDKVDAATAAMIFSAVGDDVRKVLVTHLTMANEIINLVSVTGATAIQLHGDCSEKVAEEVRAAFPRAYLIKAIHVVGASAIAHAKTWAGTSINALLLDSRTADRLGGTGNTHDWTVSAEIVTSVRLPVILAGGLNPENVQEAIRAVRPMGVDVNSGVEDAQGAKATDKVRAFVRGAASALALLRA